MSYQVEQKVTLMTVSGCRLHRQTSLFFLTHTPCHAPGTQSIIFLVNPEPLYCGMILWRMNVFAHEEMAHMKHEASRCQALLTYILQRRVVIKMYPL